MQNINLSNFSSPHKFSFNNLSDYKFGGVYIIFSVDKNGNKEIVKIGESNFVFRRIANYLSPLEDTDKSENKHTVTKQTIQEKMKKGEENGLTYEIRWKIEDDTKSRKQIEKDLISEFKTGNKGNLPVMNKNNR